MIPYHIVILCFTLYSMWLSCSCLGIEGSLEDTWFLLVAHEYPVCLLGNLILTAAEAKLTMFTVIIKGGIIVVLSMNVFPWLLHPINCTTWTQNTINIQIPPDMIDLFHAPKNQFNIEYIFFFQHTFLGTSCQLGNTSSCHCWSQKRSQYY